MKAFRPLSLLSRRPKPGWPALLALAIGLAGAPVKSLADPSIARVWDEEILSAIRIDKPNPPVHARNLFSLSACMYDAWAAYDPVAVGYAYRQKQTAVDVAAARREAISYAAYRMLKERYAFSVNAAKTLPLIDAQLVALGYDTNNVSRDITTPAGLGNAVYDAVHDRFINDGALQTRNPAYSDLPPAQGGYAPVNGFLNTGLSGTQDADENGNTFNSLIDVNHWQPLKLANAVDQNGLPTGPLQSFLGSQWLGVLPFALTRTDATKPWIDLGPPPQLGGDTTEAFRTNVVEVILRSSQLTPDDGVTVDISPGGSYANNSLGANDGTGHALNPITGQPYAPNVVKRGDFARVLTEFWADGPNSETPPGHWNTVANGVSDSPALVKRIGGTGPVVDGLEWDVKVYFAINGALHDAACTAWSLKRKYDGWRPIAAIRHMGELGQSSDPAQPAFNALGLPLTPGLIELVTADTAKAGGRHAGLTVGKVALFAYPGPPTNPTNSHSGVKWVLAQDWTTYQKTTFVSPAFPGYISGHSTFSRAAAEVMTELTGSAWFPGGLGTYDRPVGILGTEQGPSASVQLQWGTYYDAADQAGISRLWGGIHPPVDDFSGRRAGSQAGKGAWALARQYFNGSILTGGITATPLPNDSPLGASGVLTHIVIDPNAKTITSDAPADPSQPAYLVITPPVTIQSTRMQGGKLVITYQ